MRLNFKGECFVVKMDFIHCSIMTVMAWDSEFVIQNTQCRLDFGRNEFQEGLCLWFLAIAYKLDRMRRLPCENVVKLVDAESADSFVMYFSFFNRCFPNYISGTIHDGFD